MGRTPIKICWFAGLLLALAFPAWAAEIIPSIRQHTVEFTNSGNLDGFTGSNQRGKISVVTNELGRVSLRCDMVRSEPDTPTGGCHAEAHLARFPEGKLFGPFPGFRRSVTYRVKFDTNCDAADVAFFQIKNNEGQRQWDYLVALWRQSGQDGDRILLQSNPFGTSRLLHGWLSHDGLPPLAAGRWHDIRITGYFTTSADGWLAVNFDGHDVTWYQNAACTKKLGVVVPGPMLANIADSQWQLQLGGYGYFKKLGVPAAADYISDIVVETWE